MAILRGYTRRGTYAELPRSVPDYTLPSGWGGAADYTPTTAAELATALSSAAAASGLQIIELAANSTITGVSQSLPVKMDGYPIVIRTSAFASLPKRRITTGDSAMLATIEASSTNPWCITSAFAAHDYYFVGIKITRTSSGGNPTTLVRLGLGGGSTSPTNPSQLPTRIFFDRCWIAGNDAVNMNSGIRFDVNTGAITRCRIDGIRNTGADAQAIIVLNNAPGEPILWHDNFLEATGENTMLGGGSPPFNSFPWNVWDVTVTRNHYYKRLEWCPYAAEYAGTDMSVKNIFELKCGRRGLVEGNIFEHTWGPDQDGAAIVCKSALDSASGNYYPEYGVQDWTFRYNIIRHVAAAIRCSASQSTVHRLNRVHFYDNLCYGLYQSKSVTWAPSALHQCEAISKIDRFTLEHNTFYTPSTTNYTFTVEGGLSNLRVRNNLWSRSTYGVKASGVAAGTATLNAAAPGYVFDYNALPNVTTGDYPANNFAPNTVAGIGYTDATNGDDGDYSLSSGSPYKNAGSDGRDIGCDVAAVLRHTNNVA